MACACIDIGTNTTRLLVAERGPGGLRELLSQRVFTRVRRSLAADGAIPPGKLIEVADVVGAQADAARALGAVSIAVVATAAIRDAANAGALAAAVRARTGIDLRILDPADEARLAFAGATRTLAEPPAGLVGVVDVGGGSTELAVGTLAGGVEWWTSAPVGSGTLCDAHLRGDPPQPAELAALRAHAAGALRDVRPPRPDLALAVGGGATSLRRLAGARLDAAALGAAVDALVAAPAAEVARRHRLDPERVRLLPGALAILERAVAALGAPLSVACGGLREAVVLEALDAAGQRP